MFEAGTLVGSYRVLAPLGRGTTAVVFNAVPVEAPDQRVALKVALPGATDEAGPCRARSVRLTLAGPLGTQTLSVNLKRT